MLPPRKSNSLWGYGFFKKGFKSNRFHVVVWSQNLRFSYFSFLKGFPAKTWLVLHVLSLSLPTLSTSFLLVVDSGRNWRYDSPKLIVNEVKLKKWKVKSESDAFLVLYFSWNLYILYIMYIPLLLYERKSAQQLSYVFNILDKLESCPHENKIL